MKDLIDNKIEFLKLISKVEEINGMHKLLTWLQSNSSDFFQAPASTRFHGCYEGGLLEHSLQVYRTLVKICNTFDTDNKIPERSIIISALFHDICKVNVYHPVTKYTKDSSGKWYPHNSYEFKDKFPIGHGEKSVIILQQFIKLTPAEMMAIRYHMGPYGESNLSGLSDAQETYPLVVYLHMADMIASKIYKF